MNQQANILKQWQRAWRQMRGEQFLTTTMWGRDYPLGTFVRDNERCYRITRYVRAADGRSLEVWGKAVSQPRAVTANEIPMLLRHADAC